MLEFESALKKEIKQIKDKNYISRFLPDIAGQIRYTGKVLAVGLTYDRQTKQHCCLIETLREAM
ncbi:MAG: hypothetical protein LBR77_07855 [Lachnospiraceae bacterium]|jgi:hypothetical protein|nr:hypothetical protein [Lachnospiraceae bacterium]